MEINLLSFGQIAEITGAAALRLEAPETTDELLLVLRERFPALNGIQFLLAVDQEVASENIRLHEGATVALLPPFSGG